MSNFIEEFNRGRKGKNRGIPFGKGLENLTRELNGISPGMMHVVAGPEKSGKTTLVDYAFLIEPYLFCLKNNISINWVYYSFEISRIRKEFDFMAHFLNTDYGIEYLKLPKGIMKNGENIISLSPTYLRGVILDDNENPIIVDDSLLEPIKNVYEKRILPLFGEYSTNNTVIKKGLITFVERRENPTGIYKDLLKRASNSGKLIQDDYGNILSYTPDNPDSITIVIIDHVRKVKMERNWLMKQTVDKLSEYAVILRNGIGYNFVPIIHTNRNLASIERLKASKGDIYPTNDDLKDSGNFGEDCDYLLTIFNPNDDKFALKSHFGIEIRDNDGNRVNPNLRTLHLVSSRHCDFPIHFKVNMDGKFKKFKKV